MISSHLQKKLQEAFSSIDVSQDGSIDWEELQECCQKIQVNLDDTDKEDFTKYSHCSESPQNISRKPTIKEGLNFHEFSDFVRNRLRKTFEAVDVNRNGFIDHKEIEEVLYKVIIICYLFNDDSKFYVKSFHTCSIPISFQLEI